MGSIASFQFSKGSRCSDPPPRVSRPLLGWCRPYSSLKPDVKYDIPKGYEQQNSNAPDELLSNREEIESLRDVREELESLRVVRDRETMGVRKNTKFKLNICTRSKLLPIRS